MGETGKPPSLFKGPENDEKTFYLKGHEKKDETVIVTMMVRAPSADNAVQALSERHVIDLIIEARKPKEKGFTYRPDGTVMVGASDEGTLLYVFGPFDDISDARNWIKIKEVCSTETKPLDFFPFETNLCIGVALVDGTPTIIEFPPGVLDTPL